MPATHSGATSAFPGDPPSAALPEALAAAARTLAATPLATLFERDPERAARLGFTAPGLRADLSKRRVTPALLDALVAHAQGIGLPNWIAAMFAGERINLTERRAVLHWALRARGTPSGAPLVVDGQDVMQAVATTRARVAALARAIRAGERRGATGEVVRDVVAIGIGGSDLGPRLACDALDPRDPAAPARVRFVSNVDPDDLARALSGLDPARTLLVVTSKTFTTQETLANARAARAWLDAGLAGASSASQVVAVTADPAAARAFGVHDDAILPMWDFVGGRYSLWSAVGVSIAIALGEDAFDALLDGAAAMDTHFRDTPLAGNLPVLMALCDWLDVCAYGASQRVVVPYARSLALLPAYLQQLTMESNGKRVTRAGEPVGGMTAPALWGGAGTDGQHAFFQWLHQGTHAVPVEFIVPRRPREGDDADRHTLLVANAVAQSQALLVGREGDGAHACPGNRPSTVVLVERLDAWHFGALLALWEHRTFVEGCLYGINSFDQYGVELGKSLAQPIITALREGSALPPGTDASTRALCAQLAGGGEGRAAGG